MSEAERIIEGVSRIAESLLPEFGMEMVDLEFRHERGRWTLRIFIDRDGGVTIDDCARVSRELGDVIDAENIIDYSYVLEVSSPGLDRPLRKEQDFIRSIGKLIKLEMARPVNKRRNFTGRLAHVKDGMLRIRVDDTDQFDLPIDEIKRARIKYEFTN
ncbi:MAG: ribosome maturation factor RimP [Deltaproteobacteria bacterium]|nr:ribosome maturation factor RimP [Deltaproteobacteria bacterium]MBW2076115.1 ribosome maturation factor RimP [Deltaproteobacteria bacterium]RLB30501.1 MAG: ribosome maturation factor RimP [Deltaproteobacteria bacterium]